MAVLLPGVPSAAVLRALFTPTPVLGPFHRLRRLVVSNVWLVDGGPGDRFLVDTGHPAERATLLAGLRALPFSPRDLTGVLLTHHHSDHAGNAAFLRRSFGVPTFAHALDAEVLTGAAPPPRLTATSRDPITRLFSAIENRTATRVPVDRALEGGDAVASLEVHHAPGHTRGSLLFRHAGTRSLLSGDALLAAVPPLTFTQGMCLPWPDFSVSHAEALASLRAFHAAGHAFDNLLAGHGRPILGGARDEAARLLDAAHGREAEPRRGTAP